MVWAVAQQLTGEQVYKEFETLYRAWYGHPSRIYMAGPRTFPSLVNTIGDAPTNEQARANVDAFDRPVLGCFGLLDPIFGTVDAIAATRDQIAGAAGQPHRDYPDAGHMIQEDAGADLAAHIAAWMHDTPPTTA